MVLIPDRAILAMMGGQTLIWAALFYTFVGLVPAWQRDFAWSDTAIMLAFSVAALVWGITTPLAGRAIDRGWGPWLLPAGGTLGAILMVLLILVDDYVSFLILWAAIGLTMAATLYEPAFALVLRARGETARAGITAIAIAAGFASTVSYPIVHLVTEAAGWRIAALVMAGIALLLAVPMLALGASWLEAESMSPEPQARSRRDWRSLLSLPHFPVLALAFALVALVPGAITSHLFPLMADRGVPTGVAVFAAAMIGPAQVAGRILVTLAAPRAMAGTIVLVAMLSLAASAALFVLVGWLPSLVFLAVLIYGVGNGLVGIFRPVLARERYGGVGIGVVAGGLAGPALVVAACAPVIGAGLVAIGGYPLMLWCICAAALIGAALLFATEPRPQ
ncbi:MAG: MFS transporter [Pseudomonadota bacterium]